MFWITLMILACVASPIGTVSLIDSSFDIRENIGVEFVRCGM